MNPHDPMFLLSKSLNERLGPREQEILDRAQAHSEELKWESDRLRAVDRLVRAWGLVAVETDWKAYEGLVQEQVEDELNEQEWGGVDRVIGQWGSSTPVVDEAEFARAVLERIRNQGRSPAPMRRIIRLGAPLAAAAALFLAVVTGFWPTGSSQKIVQVVIGPTTMENDGDHDGIDERVVVTFARTDAPAASADGDDGIGILTVGSAPIRAYSRGESPM